MATRNLAQQLLAAELAYHDAGWSTILVTPGAKAPPIGPWRRYQQERRSPQVIKADRRRHPQANIGLVTGKISGYTVIDLDGALGLASYQEHLAHLLPPTRRHKTPGGIHLIFEYDPGFHTGAAFLPGVDVRNDGGYIVAPPSVRPEGVYQVIEGFDHVKN